MIDKHITMTFPGLQPLPVLIVLSGPSGVGKDAVLKRMKEENYPLHNIITITTRPIRQEEHEGVDYYFKSPQEFQHLIEAGELLEWAQVYNHYYGVPRGQIRDSILQGQDVIVKVDIQGAATIKKLVPEAILVFLMPPSLQELEARLVHRNTEFSIDLERRIDAAQKEMKSLQIFDY
ncbi:guanylate kinase, partial [Chloroflexota bacterium]